MHYKLTPVINGSNEDIIRGYKYFKDENGLYYSVWMNGENDPDPATWATLLPHSGERNNPIFTAEYCKQEGSLCDNGKRKTILGNIRECDTIEIV